MSTAQIRKQVSVFIPIEDWKMLRYEAARRHETVSDICREWMKPGLEQMREESKEPDREFEPVG